MNLLKMNWHIEKFIEKANNHMINYILLDFFPEEQKLWSYKFLVKK